MNILSVLIASLFLVGCQEPAYPAEIVGGYDVERLATAIFHAEGGNATRHPYGILAKYKVTTPRQACINTIRSKHKEWTAKGSKGDYLRYLQSRYAPTDGVVLNDPTGLNRNWYKNVKKLYLSKIG